MTPQELIKTAKGRNHSKDWSDTIVSILYYMFVTVVAGVIAVAMVDLVFNFRIV